MASNNIHTLSVIAGCNSDQTLQI